MDGTNEALETMLKPDTVVKKVFISGKITGDPDYLSKFCRAERNLVSLGHFAVMNPAILPERGFTHEDYMEITLAMLHRCDAVCYLSDWNQSIGAMRELDEAVQHGLICFSYDEWMERMKGIDAE